MNEFRHAQPTKFEQFLEQSKNVSPQIKRAIATAYPQEKLDNGTPLNDPLRDISFEQPQVFLDSMRRSPDSPPKNDCLQSQLEIALHYRQAAQSELSKLRLSQSVTGLNTSPEVLIQIEDLEEDLEGLKNNIGAINSLLPDNLRKDLPGNKPRAETRTNQREVPSEVRQRLQQRLHQLELRKSISGLSTSPEVNMEIEDIRSQLGISSDRADRVSSVSPREEKTSTPASPHPVAEKPPEQKVSRPLLSENETRSYTRRLQILEQQKVAHGARAPRSLTTEINGIKQKLGLEFETSEPISTAPLEKGPDRLKEDIELKQLFDKLAEQRRLQSAETTEIKQAVLLHAKEKGYDKQLSPGEEKLVFIKLQAIHRDKEQIATMGEHTPPHVFGEIEDYEIEIAKAFDREPDNMSIPATVAVLQKEFQGKINPGDIDKIKGDDRIRFLTARISYIQQTLIPREFK